MYRYVVKDNQYITPSTILLTLQSSDGRSIMPHRAGQYAVIGYRRNLRPTPMRCFSVVSSPTEARILQFSMRTRGHFTRGLTSLKQGDEVTVQGPYGGFVFDQNRDKKTVLIAGGIGITPYMSMIRYIADTHMPNETRLLYSCATQDDIPFLEELKMLQARNVHFKVLYFIGSGPVDKLVGQHVYEGRITADILDEVSSKDYTDKTYFICGPPPFMKGMLGLLRSKNTPMSNIMTEAFGQGANRQTGKIHNWPVSVYVLAGIGVIASSLVITMIDFFRTIPPSTILIAARNRPLNTSTNPRQQELDSLVSSLGKAQNGSPASPATVPQVVTETVQDSSGQVAILPSPSATSSTKSLQTTAVTLTPTPVPTPTPSPSPAPTPAPKPVCTTSPSGVVTCK